MKNDILTISLSKVKINNNRFSFSENTQNKGVNCDLINANQRFNQEPNFNTIDSKKSTNSYLFLKQKKNNVEVNNKSLNNHFKIKHRNNFLPVLPRSVRNNNDNKKNIIFQQNRQNKIEIKKRPELIINPISLYLNTESNEKKNSNRNLSLRNKIKDEFMERVKDYRKRLREQMIKRSIFQYSRSNNYLNSFQNLKVDKDFSQEKKQEKEKEKNEKEFNYNQNNKYIFKMNENVDTALNLFYNKLKKSRILAYKRGKSYNNYSNFNSERNLSNSNNTNESRNNKFFTINSK
jgi:hypothetical protein